MASFILTSLIIKMDDPAGLFSEHFRILLPFYSVTGSYDESLKVWETISWQCLRTIYPAHESKLWKS